MGNCPLTITRRNKMVDVYKVIAGPGEGVRESVKKVEKVVKKGKK